MLVYSINWLLHVLKTDHVGGQDTRDRLGSYPGNHRGTGGSGVLPPVAEGQRESRSQTEFRKCW